MNWNQICLTERSTNPILQIYFGIIQSYCICKKKNLFQKEVLMIYFYSFAVLAYCCRTDQTWSRTLATQRAPWSLLQADFNTSTVNIIWILSTYNHTHLEIFLHTRHHRDQERWIMLTSGRTDQTSPLMINPYVVPGKVASNALLTFPKSIKREQKSPIKWEEVWLCKLNSRLKRRTNESSVPAMGTSSCYHTSCFLFYYKLISRHSLP